MAKHLSMGANQVFAFDLPCGHSCPAANICKVSVNRETGKSTKGENNKVYCYAAKAENIYPSVRALRWHNFDYVRDNKNDSETIAETILKSIPKSIKILRLHSSGDFFHKNYFQAWQYVAQELKDVQVFGYTKVLDFMLNVGEHLDNFKFVYSFGGTNDAKALPLVQGGNLPTNFIITADWKIIDNGKRAVHEELGLTVPIMNSQVADDYNYIQTHTTFGILEH
jgi:hypothetical protein